MELEQTTIQKTFTVKHKGKSYYVDYLNSDGQTLGLSNRNNWEISGEDHEELEIYAFQGETKENKLAILKNQKLADKLVDFCIKNFNAYNPLNIKSHHAPRKARKKQKGS